MQQPIAFPDTTPAALVPPSILRLEQAFDAELAQIQAHRALAAESSARWAGTGVSGRVEVDDRAERSLVYAVFQATVREAEVLLSTPGAPLRCEVDDWLREHFTDKEDSDRRRAFRRDESYDANALWRSFRPTQLWAHIVSAYSPDRIVEDARRRAAVALVKAFGLAFNDAVRQVAGRVEIEIRMWSEPCYSRKGRRRYTTSSADRQSGLAEAIAVFIVAAGVDDSRYGLTQLGAAFVQLGTYDFDFASRDRIDCGSGTALVCFNEAVKIHLPLAVAEALNLFVSEYAADYLEERRAA